jgi:hypothetical protein
MAYQRRDVVATAPEFLENIKALNCQSKLLKCSELQKNCARPATIPFAAIDSGAPPFDRSTSLQKKPFLRYPV